MTKDVTSKVWVRPNTNGRRYSKLASSGGSSGAPTWFTSASDSTWGTIASAGTISSVKPSVNPGGTDFTGNGALKAWNGAVIDTTRQELQIGGQGGHNDYYGNEVYVLPLNTATPAWQRVSDPRYSFGTAGDEMDDGSPRAVHSESQISYDPNTDKYILTAMPFSSPYGNSSRRMFAFSRTTNSWTSLGAPSPSGSFATGSLDSFGASCYDSTTQCVWVVQTTSWDGVSKYNPATNTHTIYSTGLLNSGYSVSAALSASKRCMIVLNGSVNGYDGSFKWLDLTTPTAGWRSPAAVTGTPASGRASSIVWHETSGAFIAWKGTGSGLVKLVPPSNLVTGTWQWVDVTPSGSNTVTPTTGQSNGTYGRFNIISNLGGSGRDCLVLLNDATQATYVYKLPTIGI
jgi:hypothetical protein